VSAAALLALDDGDSLSISGALTPKAWTDRNGEVKRSLDIVAHALLTTYHVTRKRQAVNGKPASASADCGAGFDDEPL
jgi:single-stranded DNA-binding protein